MSSATDWATAIRVMDICIRGHQRVVPDDEPTLLVQRITRNPVLCGGATEHFSQHMPVWHPATPDEDGLRPIDVLYGQYDPTTRSIKIFVNRINQDAKTFGAEPDELLELVRIHEHAHAVIHLGSRADDVHRDLSDFGQSNKTDWSKFLSERTSWFTGFSLELHEFLAQALTYASVCGLSSQQRSARLRELFDALEAKQPAYYRLSSSVKDRAALAAWPLVLDAARGSIDVYREGDFTLAAGLDALVSNGAEPAA